METSAVETRRDAYGNPNDWLNALVKKRLAQAAESGETLSVEMAWVNEREHAVYQRRFKPLVVAFLVAGVLGIAQSPSLLALAVAFVAMYVYIDFYGGVLHVVLDHPGFVRVPGLDVPCVEFQWHHTYAYDIATRSLFDVWGDLNPLLVIKTICLFAVFGFDSTAMMVAGVGYFWGYANQFAHRLAHTAPRKRPKLGTWLEERGILIPPDVHQVHHQHYDRSFPVLSGHTGPLIQSMLRVVPNRWVWLALFVVLTAVDLIALTALLHRVV
jgi:hypothetical protein